MVFTDCASAVPIQAPLRHLPAALQVPDAPILSRPVAPPPPARGSHPATPDRHKVEATTTPPASPGLSSAAGPRSAEEETTQKENEESATVSAPAGPARSLPFTTVHGGFDDVPTTSGASTAPAERPPGSAAMSPISAAGTSESAGQLPVVLAGGLQEGRRAYCLGDFDMLCVVGQGAFGKVFQVRKKDDGKIFALKVMRKDHILEKDHAEYITTEKAILTRVTHPYIVTLKVACFRGCAPAPACRSVPRSAGRCLQIAHGP